MHIAFFLYNVYNKRTKIRALKPTKEVLGMSGKVDYNNLRNIIDLAPLVTLGDDGTLSVDDSCITAFKRIVIQFCIEKEVQDGGTAVIDEIVTTANYDSVTNVIKGLKNGDISDVNDAQCNKFANEFVQEVNRKIKNKKWYHQIVIMQCAIIDAIHTIFKECGELLTSVDSRIILGLATSFKHWFENSRIQDSDFSKIESAVDSFLKKLTSTDNYDISSIPENLKNFFRECFGRINDNIDKWIKQCNGNVDRYKSDSASKSDVKQSKKTLENIVKNISKDSEINNKLIMKLSINLSKIFNVNDIYLIQENVKSFVNNLRKKKQTSKSSDSEKKPHSVELEKDKSNTKISATRENATKGSFEPPVIEKVKVTKLDEQRAEYIDQPESNDDNVAMPGENNQRFKEFLKSFEKNYMNTNDYNWVDTCTQGLGNANDIEMLKAQLTNLIKAITRNDWIAASSAMIIGPLSKTLSKIFRVNDDSNDDVKSEINAVIKKQKLLQNFLKALEKSFYPFNANAWWNNLGESTLFSTNLESPLLDFMKCVTGEIDDANINKKTEELSDALCKDFAVNNTGSITTRLNEIVQRVKDMQKSLKEKYGTDIVDNLLKVIDFVAAQGYVDLSSDSLWELVDKELRGFKDLLETADKRQCAVNVIHEVLQGINEGMDSETIAQSSAISLVNSGVINTDDKDKAVKKITSKMQELRNKRNNESSITEQNDPAPQPQIVETNTAQVQQETSSPATDPQKLSSQTSEGTSEPDLKKDTTLLDNILDKLSTENNLQNLKNNLKSNTAAIKRDEAMRIFLEHLNIKNIIGGPNSSIYQKLSTILYWSCEQDNINKLQKKITEFIDCLYKCDHTKNNDTDFKEKEQIKLSNWLNTNFSINFGEKLDEGVDELSYEQPTRTSKKIFRFAKRAVKKQERQKHTEQKNNNADVLVDAVIEKLPCEINKLKDFKLDKIETILRNTSSNLISSDSHNTNTLCNDNVSAKTIETIAKPLRNTAKKTTAGQRANSNSDSILALAVLYKVLTAAIDFKKPEENKDQIEKLFKAFAKWFNKYVSPRSAIRSTEIVQELNRKIGTMAGGGDMFKCGKLIRAKNAIKKIAKKDNNSSGYSAGTNSESVSHKEKKRDKFKRHFKKLSPRKLFSRNKKENPNAQA